MSGFQYWITEIAYTFVFHNRFQEASTKVTWVPHSHYVFLHPQY